MAKRGGSAVHVPLGAEHIAGIADPNGVVSSDVDIEAVNKALEKLSKLDARTADVVRYRIRSGFTNQQTAGALGVGLATVERDWAFARAWLAKELSCQS